MRHLPTALPTGNPRCGTPDIAGTIRKFRVGDSAFFARLDFACDGSPVALSLTASHSHVETAPDETLRGMLTVLAETATLALQHGCPLASIAARWERTQFAPRDGIGGSSSIPDALARWFREQDLTSERSLLNRVAGG